MEPANIDWNNIESIFVQDSLYEHINAPKWIDFSAPDNHVDDEAWFCKSDCRHPKTAQDFKVTHFRSSSAAYLPLRDGSGMNKRLNKATTFSVENENPNYSTPSKNKALEQDKGRKLKSTASASNLFAGRDILNQITDFCSELKNMVMKGEDAKKKVLKEEKLLEGESQKKKKPLGEMKTPPPTMVVTVEEKKQRRIKRVEKENNQISLDMNVVGKGKDEKQRLLLQQVRTNPPSPQCFSADRRPKLVNTKPLNPSISIPLEKGVQAENAGSSVSVAGKQGRSMEMFWILKPCLAK